MPSDGQVLDVFWCIWSGNSGRWGPGSCSSSLDAGSTKGFTPLDLSFCSEAFGLGAFYEETTRELDSRRAEVLARTPAEPEEPAEDTSGVIKMAVKFDR